MHNEVGTCTEILPSMKRSQTNKCVIVYTTFLENQAKIIVFRFQIGTYCRFTRFSPFVERFAHFPRALWSMHSQGRLGIFKIVRVSYPRSVCGSKTQVTGYRSRVKGNGS